PQVPEGGDVGGVGGDRVARGLARLAALRVEGGRELGDFSAHHVGVVGLELHQVDGGQGRLPLLALDEVADRVPDGVFASEGHDRVVHGLDGARVRGDEDVGGAQGGVEVRVAHGDELLVGG